MIPADGEHLMVGVDGEPKLRVVNNLVHAHEDKAIKFENAIAGNISVTAPNHEQYLPGWPP